MGWGDAAQAELESSPLYLKLLKAFRLFDKNGDGFIDASELQDLLTRANPDADPTKGDGKLTADDAQALISSFDDNGDGLLSIEELCAAWAIIGGSNEALKTAMTEKRAEAKEALKKAQAKAAEGANDNEFKLKAGIVDDPLTVSDAKVTAASPAQIMAPAPTKKRNPDAYKALEKAEAAAAAAAAEAAQEQEMDQMSAAEKGKAAAAAKVGKTVKEGQGSLADVKEKPFEEMTAAERAKAKAKAELEAKEARKKAAKEAKAKAEAEEQAVA